MALIKESKDGSFIVYLIKKKISSVKNDHVFSGKFQDEQLDQIECGALEFKFAKTIVNITAILALFVIAEKPALGFVMHNDCIDGIIAENQI